MDTALADEYFNIKLDYLKACDESMDIIVLPEYSDAPCCTHTWEETCAGDGKWEIVDRAIRYGCGKVQLFKPFFDRDMIDRAHKAGIVCNVFWSDDPEETEKFLEMGIDTVLTNDYNLISQAVERFKNIK